MVKKVYYLFDPLCGWCYGATPAIHDLRETANIDLELLPTGLFSGTGARAMDAEFAAYAWSNDQRIERLTGQQFTQHYRTQVLGDHSQRFDSGPATIALTAVALTAADKEMDALKAIQQARYVRGQDVTAVPTLTALLRDLGLTAAAALLELPDQKLLDAVRKRTYRAQVFMQDVGARGVPTLIVMQGENAQLVHAAALFGSSDERAAALEAAGVIP